MNQPILFTDLDGTLIEFHTYATHFTRPLVTQLVAKGIPIVLCSSKTRREQLAYRTEFGLPDPFIVENGSAIYIPSGYFPPLTLKPAISSYCHPADGEEFEMIVLGTPIEEILTQLRQICQKSGLKFSTYDDLSLDQICQLTGLTPSQADSARAREYSATILTPLVSADSERLSDALKEVDLQLLAGGRFYTVSSARTDKGLAVAHLTALYQQIFGPVTTIGLGDSANDRAMFTAVEKAYLVQRPDQTWEDIPLPNLDCVPAVGPHGWNLVAKSLLEQLLV